MGDGKPETRLERGAAPDLWRNTLSRIPTRFGRLVYLSSLRDQNSGAYEHHGLIQIFGVKQADQTLRQSHSAVFGEWLRLNLEEQKTDVQEYLCSVAEDAKTTLATWLRLRPYRNLVPAKARDVERKLFLLDLEAVLEVLKNELGVASPDPNA